MCSFHCQVEQVAFVRLYALCHSFESLLYFGFVTTSFQFLQCLDLLVTRACVINLENIDRSFFLQTVFVYADGGLRTTINTSLSTGCCFFDTHFWNARFDSLSHTAKFLDFLDMLP